MLAGLAIGLVAGLVLVGGIYVYSKWIEMLSE
jgi:hypothetical protein